MFREQVLLALKKTRRTLRPLRRGRDPSSRNLTGALVPTLQSLLKRATRIECRLVSTTGCRLALPLGGQTKQRQRTLYPHSSLGSVPLIAVLTRIGEACARGLFCPLSLSSPCLFREAIAPRCAEVGCISKLVFYSSICGSGGGSERVYSGKRWRPTSTVDGPPEQH